ncbi:hypothetical protein HY990_03525 [Candidatus Micrarchaeota archaeon]|nr:hypothetical protein [Candidatus Micrarchaeota archaeon]
MAISNPKVLFVASMNGGAEAIAPLARRAIAKWGPAAVSVYAYGESIVQTFRGMGVTRVSSRSFGSMKDLTGLMADFSDRPYTHIITGTQLQSPDLGLTPEQASWILGKLTRACTLAVVDTWANYVERFSDLNLATIPPSVEFPLTLLPQMIAVIDDRMKADMSALGFDPGMLQVTGNPYFEFAAAEFARQSPTARENLLSRPVFIDAGFTPNAKTVVFFSDSFKTLPKIGFTEASVLSDFLTTLDALAAQTGMAIQVIVRPHPKRGDDAKAAFDAVETRNLRKVLHHPSTPVGQDPRNTDPTNSYSLTDLLALDLVAGTLNNPLLTAAVVGSGPRVQVLPNLGEPGNCYAHLVESGVLAEVRSVDSLMTVLEDALSGKLKQSQLGDMSAGATDRILGLLDLI